MTVKNKLRKRIQRAINAGKEKTVPAVLGNYSKVVSTGNAFEVYARLASGQVIKVINQIAPNTYDLKVTLGKRDGQRFWQVIGVRDVYNGVAAPNVPAHGNEHRYMPVYRDQMIPLLIFPINDTLTVQVYGSVVIIGSSFVNVQNQVVDLTSSQPVNGARYILFQYDENGVVTTKNGSIVESKEILTLADIPTPDQGNIPFGAVRIAEAQTEFTYLQDFVYPFGVGSSSIDWGMIGGDIHDQTDLMNELQDIINMFDDVFQGHEHAVMRWNGGAGDDTFDLPDIASQVESVSINGLSEDPTNYELSLDGTQVVFVSPLGGDSVIVANYIKAQLEI